MRRVLKLTQLLPRLILPLAISALALWLVTRNLHWSELKAILKEARVSYLFAGFFISLFSLWLRAVRWQVMLQPFQDLPAWALLRWQIGGIMVNNLLPLRIGEFARTYWASHKSSIPRTTVLATIVMERVLDVGTIAIITILLFIVMKIPGDSPYLHIQTLALVAILGLALVFGLRALFKKKSLESRIQDLKPRLPAKAGYLVENFVSGLHVLKDKNEIMKLCLLSPLIWSVDIAVLALASRSLGLNLSWMQAGLTMGGLILGVMIPAAPGAVGTFEAGGVQALALMGFNKSIAFSFIAMLHAFQMSAMLVMGIPALMFEGFNPKKLYEEMETEP